MRQRIFLHRLKTDFERFSEDRKRVFLVTKADIFDPVYMTKSLNNSLKSSSHAF
jgi:hypothetical protein